MNFSDGKYETPSCCSVCKGKNLLPDRQSAVTVDWQRIRLQEIVSDENRQYPSTCTFFKQVMNRILINYII
jgi:DNA replicative helicase MCM subunit Mcm2 (Cdc46/Mcm family)